MAQALQSIEQQTINMKQVLKEAALEALREFRKEEKEKVRKGRLRNTRLLMDNYLNFVEHYENIRESAKEAIEDIEERELNFDDAVMGDIIIQSIKRTKLRTRVMIRHIEAVTSMLKADMEAKGEPEKYQVIELLYMDECKKDMKFNEKISVTAEQLNCHEATVRRWNNEMIDKLAIKLFGVDGLKLEL